MSDVSAISGSCWDEDYDGESSDLLLNSDEPLDVPMFGRTRKTQLLHETFQQVLRTKCAAKLVVHGESGVGKTSLVDTLRVQIIENRGHFCAGKFFQNSSVQEPYSALMAAFSDVCDLVTQSEDFTESRQTEIQQALGADGYLLTNAISNISPLLGGTPPESTNCGATNILSESSLVKFKVACKTFLQAVSSDDHPLVLFIDDIQWMDEGSKQLLELFLCDAKLKNVLLILAYRDEEAELALSLLRHDHDLVDIPLEKLDSVAIHQMVCSSIGSNSESLRELSVLTQQRSQGNPFHAQLFLATIEREGLLRYDPTSEKWIFNVDEIRSQIMVLPSLADLLARKIDLVSDHIKETLKVASVIGYIFSEDVLMEAFTVRGECCVDSMETVRKPLKEAVKIGFVEEIKNGYQFTHDKIQTAFQEMIGGDEEVKRIHKVVGETILALGDGDDATIYHAVVHLNVATSDAAARTDGELHRLAQNNLRAAKHCISKSAFVAARDLLQFGIDSLGAEQRWTDPFYGVTSQLIELLAKTELVIGNFGKCKEATSEALRHTRTTEMKVKVLYLELEARIAHNELDQLVPSANRVLHEVGVRMPKRVTLRHVACKLLKVKMMMRGKSDEQILALPTMDDDEKTSTAIKVLAYLCTHSLMCDDEDQAVYSALRAMELTLKWGLSPSSAMSFVVYGIVEVTIGNNDAAYRFGRLALELLKSTGCTSSICPTVGFTVTLLTYRKESFSDLSRELVRAGKIGFDIGDIVHGTFCTSQSFIIDTMLGSNLQKLEGSLRRAMHQIGDRHQGEAMHEDNFMIAVKKANHPILTVMAVTLKCVLAIFFRYFDEASNYCNMMESSGKGARLSHGRIPILFCAAFSNYELYGLSRKRKYLRKARNRKKTLGSVVSKGCHGARGWHSCLLVVELSQKKSVCFPELLETYNKSAFLLEQEGPAHVEGLMNEQAGFDLAGRGYVSEAFPFFDRALKVYKSKWCSNAKYQWLLEETAQYTNTDEHQSYETPQVGNFIVCSSTCS